jgi:hypothetical protein
MILRSARFFGEIPMVVDCDDVHSDRRSIERTKIAKGALLFFSGQPGLRSCGITDISSAGAGIRAHELPAVPLDFELSFDNFRTGRKCRLAWRDGDFLGVAFET